ncbi:MAG TPA: glycosyltransferase family 2 protein [Gaiellaceae bacterium]|nr:glycosyltransferase family 2 protein [Gaiellaceae bacterium]
MKLVQTLVVRDEADIVGDQIAYHLNAGVDFVVATDHLSVDGTTDILESYAREGVLRRISVTDEIMRDGPWRTHMARLAATDYAADWVINTDADEFWMPRDATLKETLASVPLGYGVVFALSRHFVPRPDEDAWFAERMTVRVSPPVALHDPSSPYRPHLKAAHRADPRVTIGHGAHTASSGSLRALHHWHPADVLHFPFRSHEQWENKGVRRARGDSRLGQYVAALLAAESGRSAARFRALVVDDAALEQGLSAGSLRVDTRLRDALLEPTEPPAAEPDQTSVISDSVAAREADIVRLRRYLDLMAERVAALEDG